MRTACGPLRSSAGFRRTYRRELRESPPRGRRNCQRAQEDDGQLVSEAIVMGGCGLENRLIHSTHPTTREPQ